MLQTNIVCSENMRGISSESNSDPSFSSLFSFLLPSQSRSFAIFVLQFIAFQISSQAEEVEVLAVKELHSKFSSLMSLEAQPSDSSLLDATKDELQLLDLEQTLQGIKSTFNLRQGHLVKLRPRAIICLKSTTCH